MSFYGLHHFRPDGDPEKMAEELNRAHQGRMWMLGVGVFMIACLLGAVLTLVAIKGREFREPKLVGHCARNMGDLA